MGTTLPDQDSPNIYVDTPNSIKITPEGILWLKPTNDIVHFQTRYLVTPERETPLVIRCAFHGQRLFTTDSGRFAVDDDAYLVLNAGQRCSSVIESKTPVETLSVFFYPGFAEEVLRSRVTPADRLLEDPPVARLQPVQFFDKLTPHDDLVSPLLFRLRECLGQEWVTHGWLEEQNHLLLERLLQAHRRIRPQVETLPAARFSTRVELYRRLHYARDFLHASVTEPITLRQTAEVACLSPHHFLRLFKQVFLETPHQYLTRLRMEQAKRLLRTTDMTVTAICAELGFESLGSFCSLFRHRVGMTPERFRLHSRASG